MEDTCHTYVQTIHYTPPRINSNVNYGHWVAMMYQCVISCNKCPTLVQDVDSGRGCGWGQLGDTWKLCVLSLHFCCEPKTDF